MLANAFVDPRAPAPAAEYEQNLFPERDSELSPRVRSGSGKNVATNERAAVFSATDFFSRFRERSKDVFAFSCGQTVGEPDGEIAFMLKTGDLELFRRADHGQSDVSAFGKYGMV